MTIDGIRASILSACIGAVGEVELESYATVKKNLVGFYGAYAPAEYIRTNALLHSLQKTGVQSTGSGARAKVYFDTPGYQNGWVPLQSGDFGWAEWSGEQVLDNAMGGSHGGWAYSAPVWSTSLAELGDIKGKLYAAVMARIG